MSKGTFVGVGGPRWLRTDFVAATVRLAVAVPIVLGASTGAPGVVVAAAQPPSADGAFTTGPGGQRLVGLRACSAKSVTDRPWRGWRPRPSRAWIS